MIYIMIIQKYYWSKNQTTYLFNKDGETVTSNSYYRNYKNYVVKNKEMIYGPHKFVNDGKEIEVNGIQLDPMASFTKSKIFRCMCVMKVTNIMVLMVRKQ